MILEVESYFKQCPRLKEIAIKYKELFLEEKALQRERDALITEALTLIKNIDREICPTVDISKIFN